MIGNGTSDEMGEGTVEKGVGAREDGTSATGTGTATGIENIAGDDAGMQVVAH